ncbi:hypothetical protein L198_06448 [Cryptococcus wingfieldii CBS 7118]|uniref:Uncharacterized protein n=1 Tax=Cryptococcus wingfieldii CBS 7118 TaxID=1295528 RepID=A0A1E3IMC6_9TREE|nr:hypothetical protein L198_06448 [Cryptococcus wingfieldii CBS 7118]ODN89754.1 hypothetical protein L198_06448 [Cryptococcus wingfieldii CBS 7118]
MPLHIGITSLAPPNADIQAAIFGHLSAITHKPTLFALILLSRHYYSEFLPKLYHDVILDATNVELFLWPVLSGDDQSGIAELLSCDLSVIKRGRGVRAGSSIHDLYQPVFHFFLSYIETTIPPEVTHPYHDSGRYPCPTRLARGYGSL